MAHDLRRTLYNHIQRLSLTEYDDTRTGDLISRVTIDIEAIQDFINSALLGILVSSFTLLGMIGVMLYINWRFTLIALSVAPVLFLVVFYYIFQRADFCCRWNTLGILIYSFRETARILSSSHFPSFSN